jgi:hypothetical protein
VFNWASRHEDVRGGGCNWPRTRLWAVSVTARPLYHRYARDRRRSRSQSRSERCEVEKNLLPLPGIEPRPSLYRLSYPGFPITTNNTNKSVSIMTNITWRWEYSQLTKRGPYLTYHSIIMVEGAPDYQRQYIETLKSISGIRVFFSAPSLMGIFGRCSHARYDSCARAQSHCRGNISVLKICDTPCPKIKILQGHLRLQEENLSI